MRKSINRTTVIIVLVIFLSISIGYALFSDTITIEGTATAQGNFDLSVTCQTDLGQELIELGFYDLADNEQAGFSNDSCIVTGDSVTAYVELEKPGSSRFFTYNIKNTGTIDAYLKLDSELSGPAILDQNFVTTELTNISTGEVTSKTYNPFEYDKDNDNENLGFYIKQFPTLDVFASILKLSDGRYTDGFVTFDGEELEESLIYVDSNGTYYLKISPNDTLLGTSLINWDSQASTQGYTSKTTFTIPFDFTQKTSNMILDIDATPCLLGC